jgi:hypothetical protein
MNIRLVFAKLALMSSTALICYTVYLYPEMFLRVAQFAAILFAILSLPWSTSKIYHHYIGGPKRRKEMEERL